MVQNPNGSGSLRMGLTMFGNDGTLYGRGVAPNGGARTLLSWTPGSNPTILNQNISVGDTLVMNSVGHAAMTYSHPVGGVPNLGRYCVPGPGSPISVLGGTGAAYVNFNVLSDNGVLAGAAGGTGNTPLESTLPAIWRNEGQSIQLLTSPNQRFGSVVDVNSTGDLFGVVSKSGAHAGWYGVWWSATGAVERELFLYPDYLASTLTFDPNGNTRSRCHLRDDGSIIFNRIQEGDGNYAKYWSHNTGEIDLTSSIEGLPSGFKLRRVFDSNASGRIVGTLENSLTGQRISNFYLEPVPEPATLAALGVGLAALLRRRRGRAG